MCGILAIFCKNPNSYNKDKFLSSLMKIKDRGPDYTNVLKINDNIIFGHNRLKIIDISDKSNQPFQAKGCSLIFNGCIYNYKEIKQLLVEKYNFKTNGDTEVLLYALIEWGENALEKIDGMYSFIFYNGNEALISVDEFNEKPLYYFDNDNYIILSSEISPIIEYTSKNLDLNLSNDILKEFLYLGYLTNEKTIYKNVKKILPDKIYTIKKEKIHSKNKKNKTENLYNVKIDDIHNELINSLKSRLVSDQPIGLLLSTGIDSILLLVLLTEELKVDIKTFSFYEDKETANKSYIEKISKYLDIKSNITSVISNNYTASSFSEAFNDLNDCETYFPYFSMLKLIKENSKIKVILSGTGADELFYGYNKYKFAYDKLIFYNLLKYFNNFPKNYLFNKFGYFIGKNNQKFLKLKNNKPFFNDVDLDKIFTLNNKKDLYTEMRDFDLKNTLPFSIIPGLERASMRNSLENRSPYLSKKLLKLTNNLNVKNIFLNKQKNIQHEIIKRYIPKELAPKKKEGFFSTKKVILDEANILKYLKEINYKFNDLNERDIQRLAIYNEFCN